MDVASLQSFLRAAKVETVSNSTSLQSSAGTESVKTTGDVYESKLADIASRYDVRSITPRQAGAMEKELLDNGLISFSDYLSMALQYVKPIEPGVHSIADEYDRPDEPRDMLADFKHMASYQRTTEATNNVQHIVDELELFASYSHKKSGSSEYTTPQSPVDVQVAASSYSDAISKTTADAQSVVNVLKALASHSQPEK